jgi:hypothetical protein
MHLLRSLMNRLCSRHCDPRPASDLETLDGLLNGYRNTALLYLAAKLNIPDLLADGPRTHEDLAHTLHAHPPSLLRLLRGLVVLGICSEEKHGRFQLTDLGGGLKRVAKGSRRHLAILDGEEYAPAWNGLLHSIVTGNTAFDHVFNMTPWRHREKHPELNQCFNDWLGQITAEAAHAILEAYDFSPYHIIADVGGGQGALLAAILKAHPTAEGILFDQAHVVSTARLVLESAGVHKRCQIQSGSFFEQIPGGADALLLKSILHDWNDEQCLTILKNCHAGLKPGRALLAVERLLPAQAKNNRVVILGDLHMLAVTSGRERASEEYEKLFAAAGFALKRIVPSSSGHSILETIRI